MVKEVLEENIIIKSYGDKISRELDVFYNPIMKLNRDISLLVIKSYFDKKIKFCDPMAASGIRELRFVKTIPECFDKITMGDVSEIAIENIKKNFKENNLDLDKIELNRSDAINTIAMQYYDFIEIDPFGSPVPFLDIAIQRIKHKGILSVTATDTAALCGTYPKTTARRYNIKVNKTLWYDEVGLRNLIAYCQVQSAKYDKAIFPIFAYCSDHYYKIFFKVEEGREKANKMLKELSWISWDKKTQNIEINELQTKDSFGKIFVNNYVDKKFISKLMKNLNLIEENKKVEKLINSLNDEEDILGYYIPSKFQKEFKISTCPKFEVIEEELKKRKYKFSRTHNNKDGIKTDCDYKIFIEILKNKFKNT